MASIPFAWDTSADTIDATSGTVTEGATSITVPAAAGTAYAEWTLGSAVTASTCRLYFTTPSAWTSSAAEILEIRYGGGNCFRVALAGTGAPGQIRFVSNDGTRQDSSTGVMSTSTRYRVEVQLDNSAGTANAALYLGDSTTPIFAPGTFTDTFLAAHDGWRIGDLTQGSLGDIVFEHLSVVSGYGSWIGPYSTPAAYPVLSVWNGSGVDAVNVLGVWNGSGVDPVDVLGVWNGSTVDAVVTT